MAVQVQCDSCGARLTLKDDSRLGQKIKCPKCQTPFVAEEVFDAPAPRKKSAGTKGKGKKSKKKGKGKKKSGGGFPVVPVVAGAVVLVLLLGVGSWFLFFSGGGDGADAVADNTGAEETDGAAAAASDEEAMAAAMGDQASDPGGEAPAEEQGEPEPTGPPGVINTEWLPADSQVVMQFKPASIMDSAIVKQAIDNPMIKQMLEEYEKQQGMKIADMESMTVGIGMNLDDLPGAGMAMMMGGGMMGGPGPKMPQVVSVMRMKTDLDDAKVAKLVESIEEAQKKQQQAMQQQLSAMSQGASSQGSGQFTDPSRAAYEQAMMEQESSMSTQESGSGALDDVRGRMGYGQDQERGSSEPSSEGGEAAADGPKVHALAAAQGMSGAPAGPQFGLSLVNPKTLLMAPLADLKKIVTAKPTNPQGKYRFVQHDGDFVLAARLDFVKKLNEKPPSRGGASESGGEYDEYSDSGEAYTDPTEIEVEMEYEQYGDDPAFAGGGPGAMPMGGPGAGAGMKVLETFYNDGARGVAFSLKLTDGVEIDLSVGSKDSASAAKLKDKLSVLTDQLKQGISTELETMPKSLQDPIERLVTGLAVSQKESLVALNLNITPELIEEGTKHASKAVAGLMMSQPGLGGGMLGGTLEQWFPPEAPKMSLAGSPVSPESASGLPESTELAGIVHWTDAELRPVPMPRAIEKVDPQPTRGRGRLGARGGRYEGPGEEAYREPSPDGTEFESSDRAMEMQSGMRPGQAPPPEDAEPEGPSESVLELALVFTGEEAHRIVQYQEARLSSAIAGESRPLKRRVSIDVPFSTTGMWSGIKGVSLEETGEDGVMVPVRFDRTDNEVSSIDELSGEVNVRIAEETEEIVIASIDPNTLPMGQLAAAGVKVVIAPPEAGGTISLMPDGEHIVLVDLRPAPPEMVRPASGGQPPGFGLGFGNSGQFSGENGYPPGYNGGNIDSSGYGETMTDETMMEEAYSDYGGEQYGQGGGNRPPGPRMGDVPPPPNRISHLATWNSNGFQIPAEHEGPLLLTIARNVSEQTVSFSYKNVAVPPSERPDTGMWVRNSGDEEIAEGISEAWVRTEWAEPDPSEKRARLHVWIDIVGPQAENLIAVGGYTLKECVADTGKALSLDESSPYYIDRPRGLDPIDPRFAGTHSPPDGSRFDFSLLAIDPAFQSLTTFEGGVRAKLSEGVKAAVIENLGELVGKRITNDVLGEARVVPQLTVEEGISTLVIPSAAFEKVVSVDILDVNGQIDPTIGISLTQHGKDYHYTFRATEKELKTMGLRIAVHAGLINRTLNFKFENVPVPPPPVMDE